MALYYVCGMTYPSIESDGDDEVTENDGLLRNKKSSIKDTEKQENNETITNWQRISLAVRKRLKKDGLRLILLVILNGFYLYLGGVVFYFLEKKPTVVIDNKKHIEFILRSLKNVHMNFSSLHGADVSKIVANMSSGDVSKISRTMHVIHNEIATSERDIWTLKSAVFFASTVVTTIGYGNIAPSTTAGRWFCVGYAVVGIPLTVMLLALVGRIISKYINHACSLVVKTMKQHLYSKYEYDRVDEGTELQSPVWLAVLFMLLVISIFAGMFMKMEEWSFTKSLYFIFITFTTIGFGDIVPRNENAVFFNVTFLYIGLAALSITVNLLIANITLQYRKHKQKIKIVQKIEKELQDSDVEDDVTTDGISSSLTPTSDVKKHDDDVKMTEFTSSGNNNLDNYDNNNCSLPGL